MSAGGSAFDVVGGRLSRLVTRFGVEQERDRILEVYRLVCRESLAFDARRRPPGRSTINADGTPLQFSLALAASRPAALQFLADVDADGTTTARRASRARARMLAVADLLDAAREFDRVVPLLECASGRGESSAVQNGAGRHWIGVSFPPGGVPGFTTYINAGGGSDDERWARLGAVAAGLGGAARWRSAERQIRPGMAALGAALTIARGQPATGRVYARAYGLPLAHYRALLSDHHAEAVGQFAQELLGDECRYPLRSTVCSFEFGGAGNETLGAKFELCAHCAFASDAEAAARYAAWLRTAGLDAGLYADTLRVLTRGRPLDAATAPSVHAYVGLGVRDAQFYSTVYLNPGPPVRAA